MSESVRSMRADARRNGAAILAAAAELFAERGSDAQMDDIAERASLGVGTLYRHFATKQALLAAIVGQRFEAMTEAVRAAEQIVDPWDSFEMLLREYLEAAECDAAFRYGILGPDEFDWNEINEQKREFSELAERILRRARDAGTVRADLSFEDFVLITRGVMATMESNHSWRRHLTLVLEGVRIVGARLDRRA